MVNTSRPIPTRQLDDLTDPDDRDAAIAGAILAAVAARKPGATICPSEVARALATVWRPLMPDVRRIAGQLAQEGRIAVTHRGAPVDPAAARGPIRLGRAGPQARGCALT